jgi:type IV pilus assembly protein PilX
MSSRTRSLVAQQHGMALLVVMVVLALGSLLALGAARTSWLNEHLVSSLSDQQRAQAAAEALIQDAQDDIRGQRADGSVCSSAPTDAGCRGARAENRPFFPTVADDLTDLAARIGPGQDCRDGICLSDLVSRLNPQVMATRLIQEAATGAAQALGARYGQFTGARSSQPLLQSPSARAWYWVEVFQMDNVTENQPLFVYRINAYVQGHRPGTRVMLRSLYWPPPSPSPLQD